MKSKLFIAALVLAGSALPALALDSCAPGTGVVAPDGSSATVMGEEGGSCRLQAADGTVTLVAPDLLMADFGGVQPVAAPPEQPMPELMTGYYICGEEASGFEVELSGDGSYLQQEAGEGRYAVAEGQVVFSDGPLDGRTLAISNGLLAIPSESGGAPSACELIEE